MIRPVDARRGQTLGVKLLRYGPFGAERPAVLAADGRAVDVGDLVGDFDQRFFAAGGIDRLRQALADESGFEPVDLDGQRIGAPIAKPYQVLGIGLNYADHAAETGAAIPVEPVVFNKAPASVVGPNDDVLLPPGSTHTDWEVELAVVIGARRRYLADEQAAHDCIAGYTIGNDVSERHFQKDRGGQWVKGKSLRDVQPARSVAGDRRTRPAMSATSALRLDVNGERMQDSTTAYDDLRRRPSRLVPQPVPRARAGRPDQHRHARRGRAGPEATAFLAEGDVMELSVDGLGTQRQHVRRAQPAQA